MKRARVSNPSNYLYLSPDDIRFSQDTIAATFANGKAIGKTLDALVRMEVFITEIPPISVAKENGVFFTRNNRRLWVYKQLAAMNRCSFIPCIRAHFVPKEQLTTEIGGHEIIVRGDHHSETLAQFNVQKRKEMLKKIRSKQITDDVPRGTFRPRFEFMNDLKRRKVKGKRKLAPKPEVLKETKNQTSVGDIPASINTSQDDEVEPVTKARKIDENIISGNPPELEEVPSSKDGSNDECDTKTNVKKTEELAAEAVDVTGDKIDSKGDKGDKYDFQKHAFKKPDTDFASNKEVNSDELSKDWVVIDQTGDSPRDDSCTIDIKITDKQTDTNLFKFTAGSKPNSISKKSGADRAKSKLSKPKNRRGRGKSCYPANRRVNRRGLGRGGNNEVSKSPYSQPIHSSPNNFVQPQRNHLLPLPYVGNVNSQYKRDINAYGGNRLSYTEYGQFDNRVPTDREQYGHRVPTDRDQYGHGVPIERDQYRPTVHYPGHNEYLEGSFDDHMLHCHRY
ncbi:uncharacterized protein LOC123564200 [Mercenaria mercenaria]|uniref:uncharacterized protein LOC123564200 n=1 Tax=Mercenaria mercenaria TaxID=6596 RepID=UPI00234EB6AD|nr:uncharacterized protein LOC123564200 [Mercenaria mercenaria]